MNETNSQENNIDCENNSNDVSKNEAVGDDSTALHGDADANQNDDLFGSSVRRPTVEWIYPGDYNGPRTELGSQNEARRRINEDSEESVDAFVVDPNDVELTLSVEGRVVPQKLCFLKICGFVVCDDTFPHLLNPKVFLFLLGVMVVASISIVAILVKNDTSNIEHQNMGDIQQEEFIDEEMSAFEYSRITKITQAVLELSGNVTLEVNSSQSRALNWILYNDDLKLSHNSSNLLQRYSLMVFFFNLSGENWNQRDGYGTGKHECEWLGILCERENYPEKIKYIRIENNFLKGEIPNEIKTFFRLTKLELSSNQISGSIPSGIGDLKLLERLILEHNRLTGTIPVEIKECKNLDRFVLNKNRIGGKIPEFGSDQWTLHRIDLGENNLSGSIPETLGSVHGIRILHLPSNQLTGTIPPIIGRLPNLEGFDLSHNLLSGAVPTDLYRHSQIRQLILDDNFLTGTIPNLSDFLPKARKLFLHNNHGINGTIPECLGDLTALEQLRLHFTSLSGTVPHNFCNRQLMYLTVDCAGEYPEVLCSCCTNCF